MAGHKIEVALLVRGTKDSCSRGQSCESALHYRFDFVASPQLQDERRQHAGATESAHLHPFVTAAEVSLVRDQQDVLPASSSPDGAGAQQEGVVLATVVDSSDEQRLAALGNVSTGYANHRWLLRSDPTISFFKGSRLVADGKQGGACWWTRCVSMQARLRTTAPRRGRRRCKWREGMLRLPCVSGHARWRLATFRRGRLCCRSSRRR